MRPARPVRAAIEDAPVLVTAGVVFTDMVSGFFSQHIDPARTIDVGNTRAAWPVEVFAPLEMGAALDALTQILARRGITSPPSCRHRPRARPAPKRPGATSP